MTVHRQTLLTYRRFFGVFHRSRAWVDFRDTPWFATPILQKERGGPLLEIVMEADFPWNETRRYEHSKLYWATTEPFEFAEDRAIVFRLTYVRRTETIRVMLPREVVNAAHVRFRLDPFPGCRVGRFRIHTLRLLSDSDDGPASRAAGLDALKDQVRRQVVAAEAARPAVCDHYPQSLSVELTPRCNLTCAHCSSHGSVMLHRQHNRVGELALEHVDRLASEVFASLTAVGLVGRGEPLLASDRLWARFVRHLVDRRVMLTAVTNGYFLRRRITPELLPWIETLTISIDGATAATFATNRGGAHLARVMDEIRWFHALRRSADLARAPRLGFSWTIKRNNIAELPDFVRAIAELDADLLYARHLLVFFANQAEQSLVAEPEFVNGYLREAHELLERYGIRNDCPPLMEVRDDASRPLPAPLAGGTSARSRDSCMFIWRTAVVHADGNVPTCSVPFAQMAGHLERADSFWNIWNGDVMRAVRSSLGSVREWRQCANCWYREGRYMTHRAAADEGRRADYRVPSRFTEAAWDFTAQEGDLGNSTSAFKPA